MSPGVITSLQEKLKKFATNGLAKYPDQNVGLCVIELDAMMDRLAEVDDLPRDTPIHVLQGLCICDVKEFVNPFNLLLGRAELAQAQNVKFNLTAAETLKIAKTHTALATEWFHCLNNSNAFNIPGGGGRVNACYNCDSDSEDGHFAPQCPPSCVMTPRSSVIGKLLLLLGGTLVVVAVVLVAVVLVAVVLVVVEGVVVGSGVETPTRMIIVMVMVLKSVEMRG